MGGVITRRKLDMNTYRGKNICKHREKISKGESKLVDTLNFGFFNLQNGGKIIFSYFSHSVVLYYDSSCKIIYCLQE